MLSKGSRGFGVPACGLVAQVAIQAFGEAPTNSETTKRRQSKIEIRSTFMKPSVDTDGYCMGEKSVGRMYTSSTRNTLPTLSMSGFAASTYGRNSGSV